MVSRSKGGEGGQRIRAGIAQVLQNGQRRSPLHPGTVMGSEHVVENHPAPSMAQEILRGLDAQRIRPIKRLIIGAMAAFYLAIMPLGIAG